MSVSKHNLFLGIVFFLFLGVAYLVYLPGLPGTFLFDDYPNLKSLGASGGVTDWDSFKRYILSGFSGPTGRPVSLLSFLIDARDWPADPYAFKRTNVLIHLFNGVLLFFLISSLLRIVGGNRSASPSMPIVAAFCALAWLLHPFLVSTTLYVVQRMAMLPLTFTLLALIFWLKIRVSVIEPSSSTYLKLTVLLAIFTSLATFSKENGALLPVLILAIEYAVLSSRAFTLNRLWKFIFLVLPLFLILAYLLYGVIKNGWTVPYSKRVFSPEERFLTQFRVVWDYLYQWFFPKMNTTGVYHDTVEVSRGLLSPVTTIVSIVATITLISIAALKREKWPLFSIAVLFFFASQLVESTTVSLELKFEHRVYLGSIFLFLPIASLAFEKLDKRKVSIVFVAILLVLSSFTYMRSKLWGDFPTMVMVWSEKKPDSPRAQIELGKLLYEAGREDEALEVLERASTNIPDSWPLKLTGLMVKCKLTSVSDSEKSELVKLAEKSLYESTNFNLMQNLLSWVNDPNCEGLDNEFVVDFTSALLSNSRNQLRTGLAFSQLTYIKGIALLRENDKLALDVLSQSLKARSEPQKLMNIAANMATQGYIREARVLAVSAREQILQEGVYGRALAEAPELEDIEAFLSALDRAEAASQ